MYRRGGVRGKHGRGNGVRGRGSVDGNGSVAPFTARGTGRGTGRGQIRGRKYLTTVVAEFENATSTNLPGMSFLKVADYYRSLRSPELRQAKDEKSANAEYGDSAIGYVQIKRDNMICTIEAKVTPETSVNNTPYLVSVTINENDQSILGVSCNCQASMGDSCKHQTALIFSMLRRSEEPSPTEVVCYWKKSTLSTVKSIKSKTVDELSKRRTNLGAIDNTLLTAFIEHGKETNASALVIRYNDTGHKKTLYIDHLVMSFIETHTEELFTCKNFLSYCSEEMTEAMCEKMFNETKDQSAKAEWFYLRFGRITASKFYETSVCNTLDGSLVASLMGARGFKGNAATKRGQKLEAIVFDLLKQKYPSLSKSGVVLRGDMPCFGASPDGITEEYTFEIKCPFKTKTVQNYIDNGVVQNKVFFQMQLQMLMCNKKKGILVVVDPQFEQNNVFTETEVMYDEDEVKTMLKSCERFWEKSIFPLLK